MVALLNPYIIKPVATGPVAATFEGSKVGGVAVATHTITAVPFGAAAADRLVVIGVHLRGAVAASATPTSATISGVPAFIHPAASGSGSSVGMAGSVFVSAIVPTGTSGTVVLNFASSSISTYVRSFRIVGLAASSPVDTATASSLTGSSATTSIDVSEGGALLVLGTAYQGGGPIAITEGAPQIFAADVFTSGFRSVGGLLAVPETQAARPVSFSRTSGSLALVGGLTAASFR